MTRNMKGLSIAALALILAACRGPEGPTGPAGANGAAGTPGVPGAIGPAGAAGTRVVLIAKVDPLGAAEVQVPDAAGHDYQRPPILACYLNTLTANALPFPPQWFAVGATGSGPRCSLTLPNGAAAFTASIGGAPTGATVAFVLVY